MSRPFSPTYGRYNSDASASTSATASASASRRVSEQQSHLSAAPGGLDQLEAKVVILGTQGVGKTSIVQRYTSSTFSHSSTASTIGASFLTKRMVVDGTKVRLQIWDTAGQERFRSMAPMYYRGAHAAVLVYDLTNPESFADIQGWLEELSNNMDPSLIIHIVGSKLDLAPHHRAISLPYARAQIRSWTRPPPAPTNTTTSHAPSTHAPPRTPPHPSRFFGIPSTTSPRESAEGSAESGGSAGSRERRRGRGRSGSAAWGAGAAGSGSEGSAGQVEELDEGRGVGGEEDIVVSEVSAKDDQGIEELFLSITRRLVASRARIARERAARERDSVLLRDEDVLDEPNARTGGWSCCGG